MTVLREELLQQLVAIESVSGSESAAADFLTGKLAGLGWDRAWVDGIGNVRAVRGEGSRTLLLMGHIDTVPGGPPVRRDGRVLWGRGAVDAKGPLVAMAVAGGRVAVPSGWQVQLVGAVGEERDSRGARFLLPLVHPSGCVIGEPSGTKGVTIGYRGRMLIRLTASDTGAHRSGDAGPSTAVVRAAAALLEHVAACDRPESPVIERPFASVLSMNGSEGEGRQAALEMDIRLPLGADPATWREDMAGCIAPFGVDFETVDEVAAHQVPRTDTLVRSFVKALREKGEKPVLLLKGGTADFNLAARWNCPMVAYGPGDSRLDHSADERLDLDEFGRAVDVLERSLDLFMESGNS